MKYQHELNLNPYCDLEEISIHDEIRHFFLGEDFGEQKMVPYIHRALRRDKYKKPQRCTCYDEMSNEGVESCPYCEGIGLYWDEKIIAGQVFIMNKRKLGSARDYRLDAGRADDYDLGFIARAGDLVINPDWILLPHLTNDGMLMYPIEIDETYIVSKSVDRYLDHSRKEYTMVILTRIE